MTQNVRHLTIPTWLRKYSRALQLVTEREGALGFMFCSDGPVCCELKQKTVQEWREDGGQDQSQDPNGFGVYLWRAGNKYEAGKSDNTRHGTDSESNKHADDNLFHDVPFSACDLLEFS